jgi:hypothetical protein
MLGVEEECPKLGRKCAHVPHACEHTQWVYSGRCRERCDLMPGQCRFWTRPSWPCTMYSFLWMKSAPRHPPPAPLAALACRCSCRRPWPQAQLTPLPLWQPPPPPQRLPPQPPQLRPQRPPLPPLQQRQLVSQPAHSRTFTNCTMPRRSLHLAALPPCSPARHVKHRLPSSLIDPSLPPPSPPCPTPPHQASRSPLPWPACSTALPPPASRHSARRVTA